MAMQFDNPSAPDYDWQKDREWFNQRLANARLHNSSLEQRIAHLRLTLRRIADGDLKKREMQEAAAAAIAADSKSNS